MKTSLANSLHVATWIVASILTLLPIFNRQSMEQFKGDGVLLTKFERSGFNR